MSNKLTATKHMRTTDDFLKLSAEDFERLGDWLVELTGEYENVEHIGGTGDKGRDTLATTYGGDLHLYQAKRYQRISYSDFEKELFKIMDSIERGVYSVPKRITFVFPCKVTNDSRDKTSMKARELDLPNPTFWDIRVLDKKVKLHKEIESEFFFTVSNQETKTLPAKPILDIQPKMGGQGGHNGQFLHFWVHNTGLVPATDIFWRVKGLGYGSGWNKLPYTLKPGDSPQEVEFRYDNTILYREKLRDLKIEFKYRDYSDNEWISGRELKQQRKSADTPCIIANEAGKFYSARQLPTESIVSFNEINTTKDGREFLVTYTNNSDEYTVKIGIVRTLLSVIGFKEYEVEDAVHQLAELKLQQMLKDGEILDYMFSTNDKVSKEDTGYEAYYKILESIK